MVRHGKLIPLNAVTRLEGITLSPSSSSRSKSSARRHRAVARALRADVATRCSCPVRLPISRPVVGFDRRKVERSAGRHYTPPLFFDAIRAATRSTQLVALSRRSPSPPRRGHRLMDCRPATVDRFGRRHPAWCFVVALVLVLRRARRRQSRIISRISPLRCFLPVLSSPL